MTLLKSVRELKGIHLFGLRFADLFSAFFKHVRTGKKREVTFAKYMDLKDASHMVEEN